MGSRSGLALKSTQWLLRLVQFCCAAIILGIFAYIIYAQKHNGLRSTNSARAVLAFSAAAILYTIAALCFLCCLAGRPMFSILAIILDLMFIAAFVYIAATNRGASRTCRNYRSSPFGRGEPYGSSFRGMPNYRIGCRLQKACLAVAIVGLLFFLFSAIVEIFLMLNRRKEKNDAGPRSNFSTGSTAGGLLSRFRPKRNTGPSMDSNGYSAHANPDNGRRSYATEATAIGNESRGASAENPKTETGYGYRHPDPNGPDAVQDSMPNQNYKSSKKNGNTANNYKNRNNNYSTNPGSNRPSTGDNVVDPSNYQPNSSTRNNYNPNSAGNYDPSNIKNKNYNPTNSNYDPKGNVNYDNNTNSNNNGGGNWSTNPPTQRSDNYRYNDNTASRLADRVSERI